MAQGQETGRLIFDGAGHVVHASGLATDPDLQRVLFERLADARLVPVGAFALDRPLPLLVAHRVAGGDTVFLLHPDPAQSTDARPTPRSADSLLFQGGLSDALRGAFGLEEIVGSSEAIQQLKSDIRKIAPLQVPVLIVGESGTGKELAAHALHALSPRRESRMIFVNAAALPGGLVESELFGYEPGAFTGAERVGRKGKFELANRSSLFFDEVGDMPAEIQVKLLRVLQDGVFERVGGGRPCHSDFRLICASNRNFQQMISAGAFRLDLYYRISGVTIRMPSLRERLEDIPELVNCFLAGFASRHRASAKRVDDRVFPYLAEQAWPGNVRQLLHEVERAAIFCDGQEITVADFRRPEGGAASAAASASPPGALGTPGSPPVQEAPGAAAQAGASASPARVRDAVEALEQTMIRDAMTRHGGNKKKVAEELGISRAYLYKKLGAQ